MKFYVASSLKNKDLVKYVSGKLKEKGFVHTYDWTLNENISTINELAEIGQKEKEAVLQSDFIVVILPGGKGTHIELGIALGNNKRIYLYSPTDEIYNPHSTSTFYHLPDVDIKVGTVEEFIDHVIKSEG